MNKIEFPPGKKDEKEEDSFNPDDPSFDHLKVSIEQDELLTNIDGTRKEWSDRLKSAVEGIKETDFKRKATYFAERTKQLGLDVVEDFKSLGRGVKDVVTNPKETLIAARSGAERAAAYGKYFADRNISLNEKSEKLKTDIGNFIEGYNKLPFRRKAYLTAALIGGSSIASVISLPAVSSVLAGGMYGVRTLGAAGFAINRRKGMEKKIKENPEHWLKDKSETFKNTYAGVLGIAYAGGTMVVGRFAIEKLTGWLGNMLGHTETMAPASIKIPSSSSIAPEMPHDAGTYTPSSPEIYGAEPEIPVAPEISTISVNATSGRGYEYMLKRLWEQLQEKNIDASKFSEESDIHKLLEADETTINKVVHQIAKDPQHGFFNEDGTSVKIDLDAKMTIGSDGQIYLSGDVHAPEGSATTAIYPKPEEASISSEPTYPPSYQEDETIPFETKIKPMNIENPTAPISHPEDLPTEVAFEKPTIPESAEHDANHELISEQPHKFETPVIRESFTNKFGIEVVSDKPHFYADGSERVFVYGGSPKERADEILKYLTEHKDATVYCADNDNKYRIPWRLINGKVMPGIPVQTRGFFGFFKTFMKAPSAEEFEKIIK